MKSAFVFLTVFWTIQSIVLENVTYPFLEPNILDIKLGTMLYDEIAPPENVERMKNARDTTSFETGVRLTGLQVCLHSLLPTTLIYRIVGI